MVGLIKRLFAPKPGTPPLMVRLRTQRGFVEGPVEIRATWSSASLGRGTKTTTYTAVAAQGLCIVPWKMGEQLDLTIAHSSRTGRLAVRAEDVSHLAEELWLHESVG